MNHSPEPWALHDLGTPEPTICFEHGDGTCHEIAELTGCQGMSREEREANGKRIVACVNFCKGLETEYLLGNDDGFSHPVDTDLLMLHDTDGNPVFIYRKHIVEFRAFDKWTEVRTRDSVWSVQETVDQIIGYELCPTDRQINRMRQEP